MKPMRGPAIVLIPALVVGAALVGTKGSSTADPSSPGSDLEPAGVRIAAPDALSSVWFCAGGTGVDGGAADHRVMIVNTTGQPRSGRLTAYASAGADGKRAQPVTKPVSVGPYARAEVRLAEVLSAPYVGATVELDGGGVLVEHSVAGPGGSDRASCSSNASSNWYVPVGATSTAAADTKVRETLVFLNPFPGDAVIDAEFTTDTGVRGTPEVFKAMVVPGRAVVAVDLAQAGVTVAGQVSASINVRSGRVVVDRIQSFDEPSRKGVALSGAVGTPSVDWLFASGKLDANRAERLVVFNPNDDQADIDVEVRPDDPGLAFEPFELAVRPHQHMTLDLAKEARLKDLVDRGTAFTLFVRSVDGLPVVAERLVTVVPGAPGAGVAASSGSPVAATKLVADVPAAEPGSELVLANPATRTIAQVTLSLLSNGQKTAPAHAATIEVPAGASKRISIADLGTGPFAVLIESSSMVVADRELLATGDHTVAAAVPDATALGEPDARMFDVFGG
jgi:hypothetical protein